jgi:hypothetical protein
MGHVDSAFPANIRLSWKWLTVANSLAYYDTELIKTVKSFIVQAPGVKSLFTATRT